jgi:hypothetical protein
MEEVITMMTMDNGVETKRWEDFGLIVVMDHVNPSQADFDYSTLHIPGLSGVLDYGTEIKEKNGITVPLNGLLKSELETTAMLNSINKFFFDEYKQPRSIKTIFDYEPNKYVWLKIASNFSLSRKTVVREFSIPFVQHDDNKYSIAEADDIRWGSEVIDFTADYLLGNTGTGADHRTITGNTTLNPFLESLALQPYFEINGTGTDVKITCGAYVLNVGSFTNQQLEIDTENDVMYVNGVESSFGLGNFYFVPGLPVQITGRNMNFELTVHYRDIYM